MKDDDDIQDYKKEWVGITENEVENIFYHIEFELFIDYDKNRPQWCLTFAKLVEKTLRNKNS